MKTININTLVDFRNQNLITILTANHYQLSVIRITNGHNHWSVVIDNINNIVTIYAGRRIDDKNAFTHELLHVIQEINGQLSHQTLPVIIGLSQSPFVTIFTSEIVTHINNVILHNKMINDYLNYGFPRNKFVFDYYKKLPKKYFNKSNFELDKNHKISRTRLKIFLNVFFSYRFHPNENVKKYYKTSFIDEYLSKGLITDIEKICDKWESNMINVNKDFFNELFSCLDDWKMKNNLT